MDWWKKVSVPAIYKVFAASYRYGFSDGGQGRWQREKSYFSNSYAWRSYVAGYEAGQAKAEDQRREGAEETAQ